MRSYDDDDDKILYCFYILTIIYVDDADDE